MPSDLLALLIVILAANLIAVSGSALQLIFIWRLCGGPLVLGVFTGPQLFKMEVLPEVFLRVNLFPTGSYVRACNSEGDDELTDLPSSWHEHSRLTRAGVILINVLVMALAGILLLGPARFVDSACRAPWQLVSGAWAPLTTGKALVTGLLSQLRQAGPMVLAGTFMAKITVLSMLPVPTLPMGQALLTLIAGEPSGAGWVVPAYCVGTLLVLLFVGLWALAIGAALIG